MARLPRLEYAGEVILKRLPQFAHQARLVGHQPILQLSGIANSFVVGPANSPRTGEYLTMIRGQTLARALAGLVGGMKRMIGWNASLMSFSRSRRVGRILLRAGDFFCLTTASTVAKRTTWVWDHVPALAPRRKPYWLLRPPNHGRRFSLLPFRY